MGRKFSPHETNQTCNKCENIARFISKDKVLWCQDWPSGCPGMKAINSASIKSSVKHQERIENGYNSDIYYSDESRRKQGWNRGLTKYVDDRLIPNNSFRNEDVFVENSTYLNRFRIKDRIRFHNLLPFECEGCGNPGIWNNQPLTLQLDHKNGIHNDNRLCNLRLLCPNCHSQTDTFAGRNKKYKKLVAEVGLEPTKP